jgi:hypothetical protein
VQFGASRLIERSETRVDLDQRRDRKPDAGEVRASKAKHDQLTNLMADT